MKEKKMNEHVSMEITYPYESPLKRWWNSRHFVQKRLIRFCLSMLVMVVCFPLYYLGLFGSVEGPLNPAHIGDSLANMGVTRAHSMVLFLSFLIISVSWNWIFNLVSILMGSRLSCSRTGAGGKPCGAQVTRERILDRKNGKKVFQYACEKGHKRNDAHFHPVKKGTISHSIWLISAAFCLMAFFMSY
jgi:hypothetical protein